MAAEKRIKFNDNRNLPASIYRGLERRVEKLREYLHVCGASTMIWRPLRGAEEKCSDNSSIGSNLTQPWICSGLCMSLSFVPICAEGMGEDSFPEN